MNKKIILTSIVAIAFAMPAMAEPQNTSATFPADDYMQEDTTYTGQATYGNMGVYEGEVTAQAEYEDILYNIAAGQYLPAASTSGAQCTAGNFCTGLTGATYNENSAQGLTACSTLESGAYPNSVAGASANTDCYRACTTQNANIAHATAVSGNDYYGAGTDTCYATACESGYHVQQLLDYATGISWDSPPNNYTDNTFGLTIQTLPGYLYYSGETGENPGNGFAPMPIPSFVTEMSFRIEGEYIVSSRNGSTQFNSENYETYSGTLTDETGTAGATNVYIRLTGYSINGGTITPISIPWVFIYNEPNFSEHVGDLTYSRAIAYDLMRQFLDDKSEFFAQLLHTYGTPFAVCQPNVVGINWDETEDGQAIGNNEAWYCVYGEDIRTPVAATDKTDIGKRFKGWKFVKPNNNQ